MGALLLALVSLAVILGGAGLVVVAAFVWIRYYKDQRKAALTVLADRLGYRYVEAPRPGLREAFAGAADEPAALSRYGVHTRSALRWRPHIEGHFGESVLRLGDAVDAGESDSDSTLAMAEDARLDLPVFSVAPRTLFGASLLVPITFAEHAEFEARFRVYGPDAAAVRAVLTPAIRAELLARGNKYWEGYGQMFAVSAGGVLATPEAQALLDDLRALLKLLLPL